MTSWDALDAPSAPAADGGFHSPAEAAAAAQQRPPLDLWALSEEARRAAWAELVAWVDEIVPAYSLAEWPRCWHQHRGMVAEVLALRELHRAAYASGEALQVVMWHERLWTTYGRFRHHSTTVDHDTDDQAAKLAKMRADALAGEPGGSDADLRRQSDPRAAD